MFEVFEVGEVASVLSRLTAIHTGQVAKGRETDRNKIKNESMSISLFY